MANQPGGGGGGGRAPAADPAVIRAEKVSKLGLALRKSQKVKDFKETQECSMKEWLKRFDQELLTLKKMSGIADNLTREEIVECLRDKLDYSVIKRLNTVFQAKVPALTGSSNICTAPDGVN